MDIVGVDIVGVDIVAPGEGSLEAGFHDAPGLRLLDLRPARGRVTGPDRFRLMDGYQQAPVLDAYDLAMNVPEISTTAQVAG